MLKKECINKVIQNIVIPFTNSIKIDNSQIEVLTGKIAIELLVDLVKARENIQKFIDLLENLNFDEDEIKQFLDIYFEYFSQWVKDCFGKDKYFEGVIQRFENLFMNYTQNDEFLIFEDEGVDERINDMHYQDHEKITAKTYLSYGEISDDDIETLYELKENFELLINQYMELNQDFLENFIKILATIENILFLSIEFKDMRFGLENFVNILNKLQIDKLNDNQKELAYELLSQMNMDIQKWIYSVFITQEAVDIHYFDASFLANIAQFEMMFNSKESEEDDFLF